MNQVVEQIVHIQLLDQLFITILLIIPIILIARTAVAGTRYSPILIIVIFGLLMGFSLVKGNVATPGITELPFVILVSKVTVTALIASFFVGGQEIKKILTRRSVDFEDIIVPCEEEILLGTQSTQLVYIVRAFFILIGIECITRIILGVSPGDSLGQFYPIGAYIGMVGSIIFIDPKTKINNKSKYLLKGVYEIVAIIGILLLSARIAQMIKPFIALPQIFFAMMISAALGALLSNWRFGPTLRALLFAGIPVVLAGNFIVGGSLLVQAFELSQIKAVMVYGLFGQLFWMFGGLTLLIWLARANNIRNLGPGMAGALSHSGLTGACTAGDFGHEASLRAPIMINIPFFGHIFVFSILAASAERGKLYFEWVIPLVIIGLILTIWSFKTLRHSMGAQEAEIKGLIQFSFGFQITAVFGSFLLLAMGGMNISDSAMATTAAISHFGLFAAVQGGMFGDKAATMIPVIFAMPFLIHPFVFGLFGKAVENKGKMPAKIIYILGLIGLIGVSYALMIA